MEAAKTLAQSSGALIAVSGAVDIITYGHQVVGAHNGVPMMQKITEQDVLSLPSLLHLLQQLQHCPYLVLLERWEWTWPTVQLHCECTL